MTSARLCMHPECAKPTDMHIGGIWCCPAHEAWAAQVCDDAEYLEYLRDLESDGRFGRGE